MRLCFATNNTHKLQEVRQLLGNAFELVSLSEIGCEEELAEDQRTLEGNSLQKAEYVFNTYGVSCFADDTGLEVDALNGEPGVYSARYAGPQRNSEDNIRLLLKNLASSSNRKAQFRTVITLVRPDGVHQFEGIAKGEIIKDQKGTAGFGYDPVFLPEGHTKTMAEMTSQEKNAISHRGEAFRKLIEFLKQE